jgi:hypothetical protein
MENSASYDQFQHIKDMIGGGGDNPLEASSSGALSKEDLFRQLASEHLLKQIGVDIDKFMSQKMVETKMQPSAGDLGKLLGIPTMPEDEDFPSAISGLPNPLLMPSLTQLKTPSVASNHP